MASIGSSILSAKSLKNGDREGGASKLAKDGERGTRNEGPGKKFCCPAPSRGVGGAGDFRRAPYAP